VNSKLSAEERVIRDRAIGEARRRGVRAEEIARKWELTVGRIRQIAPGKFERGQPREA
jgi:hypothetical protein